MDKGLRGRGKEEGTMRFGYDGRVVMQGADDSG